MVESSDKTWSTGEGNGKPLQHSCRENPMNSMKRQKDMTLKDELPRSVGVQCATGEEWRKNSIKNEEMEPKQKQHPAVDVTVMEVKSNAVKSNIALIHGPDIPGSYAILLFTSSDLACITSYIHSWVLFLLWVHFFILSGVISTQISGSYIGHVPIWGVHLSVSYLVAFKHRINLKHFGISKR